MISSLVWIGCKDVNSIEPENKMGSVDLSNYNPASVSYSFKKNELVQGSLNTNDPLEIDSTGNYVSFWYSQWYYPNIHMETMNVDLKAYYDFQDCGEIKIGGVSMERTGFGPYHLRVAGNNPNQADHSKGELEYPSLRYENNPVIEFGQSDILDHFTQKLNLTDAVKIINFNPYISVDTQSDLAIQLNQTLQPSDYGIQLWIYDDRLPKIGNYDVNCLTVSINSPTNIVVIPSEKLKQIVSNLPIDNIKYSLVVYGNTYIKDDLIKMSSKLSGKTYGLPVSTSSQLHETIYLKK